MYRNGLPYARYSNYAELTILEKIVKSDGKPKIKCPLSRKLINSDYISDENKSCRWYYRFCKSLKNNLFLKYFINKTKILIIPTGLTKFI